MQSSSANATTVAESEQPTEFENLRKRLTASGQKAVIDELAALSAKLEAAHVYDAAKRLRQLDGYALAMPPEVIPNLVDSQSALEEIEGVKGKGLGTSVLWRNILALAPLLITWFSLSLATSAYHDEVRQHPNTIYQPFLVLWENGFSGGFPLTFSRVAFADAILFVVIIVLTWQIHSQERRGQYEARRLVARIDGAVVALVATLIQEHMTGLNNPGEWAAAVKRVIDSALKETRELNKANEQALRAAHEAIRSAEQRHQTLVREMGGEILATLQAVREQSEQTTAAVGTEAREMFAQASGAHQQLAESSLQAVKQVGEQHREYIGQLNQESMDALKNLHEEDRQFLAQTDKEARDLLLRAGQNADELTRVQLMPAVDAFREMIKKFSTDLGQYQEGAGKLVGSVVRIGEVAERLGETVQSFSTAAQSIQTQLQTVAQTQGQYANQIGNVANEMRAGTADMRTATAQMSASAAQVNNLLTSVSEKVAPQVDAMAARFCDASNSLATTQVELAKVSIGLSRTVDAFNKLPRQKSFWPFFSFRP